MVKIKSYLKKGSDFIELSNFDGEIDDPDYIEGAIELAINNELIISTEMWDYVDQLWSYIVSAILKMNKEGESFFSFPDQPIDVSLKKLHGDMILLNIDGKKVSLYGDDFVPSLLKAAKEFFTLMKKAAPVNDKYYDKELDLIRKIEMS